MLIRETIFILWKLAFCQTASLLYYIHFNQRQIVNSLCNGIITIWNIPWCVCTQILMAKLYFWVLQHNILLRMTVVLLADSFSYHSFFLITQANAHQKAYVFSSFSANKYNHWKWISEPILVVCSTSWELWNENIFVFIEWLRVTAYCTVRIVVELLAFCFPHSIFIVFNFAVWMLNNSIIYSTCSSPTH